MKNNIKINLPMAIGIALLTGCSQTSGQLRVKDKQERNNLPGFKPGFLLKREIKQESVQLQQIKEETKFIGKKQIDSNCSVEEKEKLLKQQMTAIADVKKACSDLQKVARGKPEFIEGLGLVFDKTAMMFNNLFIVNGSKITGSFKEAAKRAKAFSDEENARDTDIMMNAMFNKISNITKKDSLMSVKGKVVAGVSEGYEKMSIESRKKEESIWNQTKIAWALVAEAITDKTLHNQVLKIIHGAEALAALERKAGIPRTRNYDIEDLFKKVELGKVEEVYNVTLESFKHMDTSYPGNKYTNREIIIKHYIAAIESIEKLYLTPEKSI